MVNERAERAELEAHLCEPFADGIARPSAQVAVERLVGLVKAEVADHARDDRQQTGVEELGADVARRQVRLVADDGDQSQSDIVRTHHLAGLADLESADDGARKVLGEAGLGEE